MIHGLLLCPYRLSRHQNRHLSHIYYASQNSFGFFNFFLKILFDKNTEIACWMYSGERQVAALRKKYLEAVLKQDVGFFDTDARTGDIVFSVSTDTLLVQDAISEKVIQKNVFFFFFLGFCEFHDLAVP